MSVLQFYVSFVPRFLPADRATLLVLEPNSELMDLNNFMVKNCSYLGIYYFSLYVQSKSLLWVLFGWNYVWQLL